MRSSQLSIRYSLPRCYQAVLCGVLAILTLAQGFLPVQPAVALLQLQGEAERENSECSSREAPFCSEFGLTGHCGTCWRRAVHRQYSQEPVAKSLRVCATSRLPAELRALLWSYTQLPLSLHLRLPPLRC
jgi:hypothetical protein